MIPLTQVNFSEENMAKKYRELRLSLFYSKRIGIKEERSILLGTYL